MNLLLDTHVWLWWLAADNRLPASFTAAISSPSNRVIVSSISVWECIIKQQTGKLKVDDDFLTISEARGLTFIPFTISQAETVLHLPDLHRDPFDRGLIAQAMREDYTLMSVDARIKDYPDVHMYPA